MKTSSLISNNLCINIRLHYLIGCRAKLIFSTSPFNKLHTMFNLMFHGAIHALVLHVRHFT